MEWINIKINPAPKDKPILLLDGEQIVSAFWEKDVERFIPNCGCRGWDHMWGEIFPTHWMAMPKPPKDE